MKRIGWKIPFVAATMAMLAVLGGFVFLGDTFWGSSGPAQTVCLSGEFPSTGQTFYVDPVRGSNSGDGSKERPWRSLQHTIDAGLVGAQSWDVHPLQYWAARLLRRPAPPRLKDNPASIVKDGDTIILAAGDHGTLDLRGIVNRAPVKIAGAAGAQARFASMRIEGASQFVFQNLIVESAERSPERSFLVDLRPEPTARQSRNIVFRDIVIGGKNSIANYTAKDWAEKSNDGIRLFGECVEFQRGRVHDVHNAVVMFLVNKAKIENIEIHDFSVDGVDFQGKNIAIRNNTIYDHWPTGDDLHPDCMHGQSPPTNPEYGNVLIEGNVCLSDTSAKHSVLLQGIDIFNGDWTNVTVRCNFVRPSISHGISMYGIKKLTIDSNIVIGWPGIYTAWISALPSLDQRHPTQNTIANNQATGYLNAFHGGPQTVAAMMKIHQVNPVDTLITDTLSREVRGVTLDGNTWLNPLWDMASEKRFKRIDKPAYNGLISIEQAKADLAAMPGCAS